MEGTAKHWDEKGNLITKLMKDRKEVK